MERFVRMRRGVYRLARSITPLLLAACSSEGGTSSGSPVGGCDASSCASAAGSGGSAQALAGAGNGGGASNGGSSSGGTTNGGSAGVGGTLAAGGTTTAGAGAGGADGSAGASGIVDAGTCTDPIFVTSDTNGGYTDGDYYIHNNMWNASAGLGPETLYACSYHDWYVVSSQTNDAGAVKTYPNVHRDYANVPLSSFSAITSTFAETSPHVGIYNVAYDIWLDGIATSSSIEIMIWTENYNQVPAGTIAASVTLGGRDYDVWRTGDGHYIAFVPTVPFTSGTVDLLELFDWTISQGWVDAGATLGQIDFGVEIVSTDGQDATFRFTDFSITNQ